MATRSIVIVGFPGVQALDISGPHETFAIADTVLTYRGSADRYQIVLVSRTDAVRSESGLTFQSAPLQRAPADIDTLILPGGCGVDAAADDVALSRWLAAQRPRRLATVCSGTMLAAAAGLISGRRVTTHWARARRLAERFPDLDVDADPVYIKDGHVWSSAGVTAGIDLSLALVRDDVGTDVAQTVARWLVMFLHRPANQSQFAAPVWITRAEDDSVRRAQELIDGEPGDDHRIGRLARRVAMSERHFQRRFVEQVGMTPGKYVAEVRFEAARRALEASDEPVAAIAARTGFGTAESMRRTFVRRVGSPPDHYRRHFATTPTTTERTTARG